MPHWPADGSFTGALPLTLPSAEVDDFYRQCDPDRDNLCLYGAQGRGAAGRWETGLQRLTTLRALGAAGEPSGEWTVDLPAEEVPSELPEPCLGINFARWAAGSGRPVLRTALLPRHTGGFVNRDGMEQKDWLRLVAAHSDAWLLSVAFYYGAKLRKLERLAPARAGGAAAEARTPSRARLRAACAGSSCSGR